MLLLFQFLIGFIIGLCGAIQLRETLRLQTTWDFLKYGFAGGGLFILLNLMGYSVI